MTPHLSPLAIPRATLPTGTRRTVRRATVAAGAAATVVCVTAYGFTGVAHADDQTYDIAQVQGNITDGDLDSNTHEIDVPEPESLAKASSSGSEEVLTLSSDILFAFDKATMPAAAGAQIAAAVKNLPRGATVAVGGHTDSLASDSRNLALSQQRAQTVAAAIRAARPDLVLTVKGHGETQPVEDNEVGGKDNPDGRAKNRRVEIRWTGASAAPSPSASGGTAARVSDSPVEPGKPGFDPANPPKPLGAVTIPVNDNSVSEARAELLQLRFKDNLLFGYFRLTPTTTGSEPVDAVAALGEFWTPRLIDTTGLKAYDSVLDLRASQWGTKTTNGQPMYLWAAWPAPSGAKAVDLQVSTIAPRIEAVELP